MVFDCAASALWQSGAYPGVVDPDGRYVSFIAPRAPVGGYQRRDIMTSPPIGGTGPSASAWRRSCRCRAPRWTLGWDSCDVILVTGDAYVDHPSFGMALVGRLLEAQGFRVGIIAQPDWRSAEPFAALGRPNLFFGVTAGNMDSMVNRYTRTGASAAMMPTRPAASAASGPTAASIVYATAQRARSRTCRSSSAASRRACGASRTTITGRTRCAARSCWIRRRTCWSTATPSARSCEIAHRLGAGASIADITDLRGTAFVRARLAAGWIEIDSTSLDARAAESAARPLCDGAGTTRAARGGSRPPARRCGSSGNVKNVDRESQRHPHALLRGGYAGSGALRARLAHPASGVQSRATRARSCSVTAMLRCG